MMAALAQLAGKLDTLGLPWALGGSWVLYRLGIHDCPRDIDIVLHCQDVAACVSAAAALGFDRSKPADSRFCTDAALEGCFGGVEADLLINFGIFRDGDALRYPLEWDRPFAMLETGFRPVPVCSPEGWYAYYRLMGDPKGRAPALEQYFRESGCDVSRLERYCSMARIGMPALDAFGGGKID